MILLLKKVPIRITEGRSSIYRYISLPPISVVCAQLLDLAELDMTSLVCNSTELARLLSLRNDSALDPVAVSNQLCNLDKDIVSRLVDDLLMQLDVGDLVAQVGPSASSTILIIVYWSSVGPQGSVVSVVSFYAGFA